MASVGFNFTERVRRVLTVAREEAARLSHEFVGTEHILLGLAGEGEGVAAAVLLNLDADPAEIRRQLLSKIDRDRPPRTSSPDLPYTSRAKKVLEFAMLEARELGHSYIGTEHLLLGLLREGKGIGAQVLIDAGLSLEDARAETLRLLGSEQPPRSGTGGVTVDGGPIGWLRTAWARAIAEDDAEPTPTVDPEAQRLLEEEERAWQRLRNALDVADRLKVRAEVTAQSEHELLVTLPGHHALVIVFPPGMKFR